MSSAMPDGESTVVPADVLDRLSVIGRELSTLTVLRHAWIAEQLGLSGTDHKCLELVMRAGGRLTAGQIARLVGLSTGAVTGVIDRLELRGFVRRVRDARDRRKVLVEVRDFDEDSYAHLFTASRAVVERVLRRFSPTEWDVIERYNQAMLTELRDAHEQRLAGA